MCQVYRNSEALKLRPYESAKSPGLKKPIPVPVFHGNRNRLEPHLVAISVPARRGRKKFMSEGEKDKYFLQCKAERKWSRVTLEKA